MPMLPTTPPSLATGDAPYEGNFQPSEPLAGFDDYHHAPDGNPASPETWRLIVKDVRENQIRASFAARSVPASLLSRSYASNDLGRTKSGNFGVPAVVPN